MSIEKFTQGEWYVAKANSSRIWSGETIIADAKQSKSIRLEEIKANANLMASSTKLYYKLHEMEIFMEQMHEADRDWTIKESQLHHKEIQELLAEARGE